MNHVFVTALLVFSGTAFGALPRPEFVVIPSGKYWIGCDPLRDRQCAPSEPTGELREVPAFQMAKFEVTREEYGRCVAVKSCEALPGLKTLERRDGRKPVSSVTWPQAQKFCQWLGGDLPTAEQWEAAAHGAEGRIYVWGDEPARCGLVNNHYSCHSPVEAVGSFPQDQTVLGVFDMIGNLEEWTRDSSHINDQPVRGGSYQSDHWHSRITYVSYESKTSRSPERGFRCVLSR